MKPLFATIAAILLPLLALLAPVYAQATKPMPSPIPAHAPTSTPTPITEVQLLQAQLDTMKEYDQKIIGVVYWALGGVFAVGVLLVGTNWFSSQRNYDRDKKNLQAELELSVRDEARQIILKELELIRQQMKLQKGPIDKIRIELTFIERDKWLVKGVIGNSITQDTNALSILEENDSGFYTTKVLSNLKFDLQSLLVKKEGLSSHDLVDMRRMLTKVPDDHKAEVGVILTLLEEVSKNPWP